MCKIFHAERGKRHEGLKSSVEAERQQGYGISGKGVRWINYTLITKNKHDDYMHRVDSNHYEHID